MAAKPLLKILMPVVSGKKQTNNKVVSILKAKSDLFFLYDLNIDMKIDVIIA